MVCKVNDTSNNMTGENILKVYSKSQSQYLSLQNQIIEQKLSELIFGKQARETNGTVASNLNTVTFETSFYIVLNKTSASSADEFWKKYGEKLHWMFGNNPFDSTLSLESQFSEEQINQSDSFFIEVGPRPTMTTPFATNAISALHAAGITDVSRVEKSRRYLIKLSSQASKNYRQKFDDFLAQVDGKRNDIIFDIFGDKMTECEYLLTSPPQFDNSSNCVNNETGFSVYDVLDPINGAENLRKADAELALGFDASDFDFYLDLFRNKIGRNPTDVELFDLAQSNSEHSRHWFFKGKIFVDNVDQAESLFETIQKTQNFSNSNNVIAFSDNSSAIKGFKTKNLIASKPDSFGNLITQESVRHIVYTAETHNFPTGVCPFPGAATGAGGRIRDVHATGRGAHEIGGIAGYSVGNLNLRDYLQPWEEPDWNYPATNFAPSSKILLEASDGASDYGNKFGEPLICGFTRSFGLKVPALVGSQQSDSKPLERLEYIKPIMFSAGIGSIDDIFLHKEKCAKGQVVAKIGGPVYRIGVGGGAASSCFVQGTRDNFIDFGAVQRGDPEMEHKLHRVIRSCIEFGKENPILSIHDQGAGGNGNVLKEIVEGECGGAEIEADAFELGDSTISLRELWGAEYQESDAVLLAPNLIGKVERVAKRERCTLSLVGRVTGDQCIVLKEFSKAKTKSSFNEMTPKQFPVNLNLAQIAEREQKTFHLLTLPRSSSFELVVFPPNFTVFNALELVLRLPSVASKRFLTTKVDRSVTGLIAQQQCVGPLQTPLADVAVTALSYYDCVGSAIACGEQPIKGIIDAGVGARMAVGEALTNLVFAPITCLEDVKCSGNWMWAAKLPGEGARLVAACKAMCSLMNSLGIAIDGGKDSLSMAARVANENSNEDAEIVKAPGTLVISAYAPCTNITKIVTPNFKPSKDFATTLLYLRMGKNCSYTTADYRLGGTALAQCLKQIGNSATDLDDAAHFKKCFQLVQKWINSDLVLSGHDISDGGLLIGILECAFAGNCSVVCDFHDVSEANSDEVLKMLFSEELGLILEVPERFASQLLQEAESNGVNSLDIIGQSIADFNQEAKVKINAAGVNYLDEFVWKLREIWEETSDRMEALQLLPKCIEDQSKWRKNCDSSDINYVVNFDYLTSTLFSSVKELPRVAILREEGSNGDREMAAAFLMAGFDAYDITMTDLLESAKQNINLLNGFRGLAFVGGFSYADVLGSAKGWAASILFNPFVRKFLKDFQKRSNTFSLGVCNGCQLMALLGFIGEKNSEECSNQEIVKTNVFLDENESGRFYSGFNTVRIERSPSLFLRGMQDSILGVWCSHGEGRFTYRNDAVLNKLKSTNLISLRYCDANGLPTTQYPENPNGSIDAVAGICSEDGRHLALMPHPDRSFLSWQCPTQGMTLKTKTDCELKFPPVSPWIQLFKNAFEWTLENE